MSCPLCFSKNIVIKEQIKKNDIVKLYQQIFNLNTSYLFISDQIYYKKCNVCKLLYFDPPIPGDEEFYNHLQKYDWYYMDDKPEFSFAAKYIKPKDQVLEIGCGKGAFTNKISTKNYTGLDFSTKAKELATKKNIIIKNQSIERHSKTNKNKYDCICAFQVLEHVKEINSFISNSLKCLKKMGY